MKRVAILGRAASGKSTLAASLSNLTGLPVIELDRYFWRADLVPVEPDRWMSAQQKLIAENETWIMDGDLGPLDTLEPRLRAADTVIVLDFSLLRCGWRAVRRSPERADFWRWVLDYRRHLRRTMESIAAAAANADVHVFRNPAALRRFVAGVRSQ